MKAESRVQVAATIVEVLAIVALVFATHIQSRGNTIALLELTTTRLQSEETELGIRASKLALLLNRGAAVEQAILSRPDDSDTQLAIAELENVASQIGIYSSETSSTGKDLVSRLLTDARSEQKEIQERQSRCRAQLLRLRKRLDEEGSKL